MSLFLGTDDEEEEFLLQTLEEEEGKEMKQKPKRITSSFSATERQKIYLAGGVLFVTTRILVMDLLTDRIPTHLITGKDRWFLNYL